VEPVHDLEIGHGSLAEAIELLLHDLEGGHGVVMAEGIRYNATCDGKNHYLYKMDKSAINPKTGHGYSKGRIYVGTIKEHWEKCPAYLSEWESKHKCRSRRSGDGHGRVTGHGNGGSDSITPIPAPEWPTSSSRH
jgi:hypothetical protein